MDDIDPINTEIYPHKGYIITVAWRPKYNDYMWFVEQKTKPMFHGAERTKDKALGEGKDIVDRLTQKGKRNG